MDVELPTDYDVIVVGTGLVECIVAAASARIGKKVLHIDRNDYYGGQWASFTLQGIEQWLLDITTSKDPAGTEDEKCDLKEGEKALLTCDPGRTYSKVKRQWYVEKIIEVEAEPADSLRDIQTKTAEKDVSMQAKETTDEKGRDNSVGEGVEAMDEDPDKTSNEETELKEEEKVSALTSENSRTVGSVSPPTEEKSVSWSQESMMKLSRRFNLDLAPKLLFSRGSLVELLISSNVARYAEFKCITRVLTWLSSAGSEGELVVVPCSRSDVFTTNSLSLIEKRLLMKLLEFCHSYDKEPEQIQDYADKTFTEFLKSRRQTPNLIHFVTESIAMVDGSVSCQEGLEKTKLFLTSLGRYGTTPFLFSMYGCGELPQAFCRLCAVFEGTYVLRRPVSSVVLDESEACVGLVSEGERFKCSHLVMDAFYAPSQYLPISSEVPQRSISRGIFIIDKSILYNEKEQLSLLRLPAGGNGGKPITVIEVGFGAGVCPKDLFCVQMICNGSDAEEDLGVAVNRLFAFEGEESNKPKLLWSLYFNQMDISHSDLTEGVPGNVYLCSGPDANLDYESAISQARSIFSRMFPEEEFLPRAPDPDEIVFDNAGAEPKQGDDFSSEGDAQEKKEAESAEQGDESPEVSEQKEGTECGEENNDGSETKTTPMETSGDPSSEKDSDREDCDSKSDVAESL